MCMCMRAFAQCMLNVVFKYYYLAELSHNHNHHIIFKLQHKVLSTMRESAVPYYDGQVYYVSKIW
jgi:hypothetical protein